MQKTLFTGKQLEITMQRLAHQLVEDHLLFADTVIIGIQPRGVNMSDRIVKQVKKIIGDRPIAYGKLDITFYRDDVHKNDLQLPSHTHIPFSIQDKNVVLVDDVLYTGRTIRSAMDALIDFGRPKKVELLVLIDRRFSRELPIEPNYTGLSVDTMLTQKIKVHWAPDPMEDEIILIDKV